MLFTSVPADAATPDPIASPADVPDSHILTVPRSLPNSDAPVTRLAIASTDSAGVPQAEIYTLADEGDPEPFVDDTRQDPASRVWRLVSSITLSAGAVEFVPAVPGTTYVRIVGGASAGERLLVGWQGS